MTWYAVGKKDLASLKVLFMEGNAAHKIKQTKEILFCTNAHHLN